MKILLLTVTLILSINTTYGTDNYGVNQKAKKISQKMNMRLESGTYYGVNPKGEKCTVEVTESKVAIKTADFVSMEENECSQRENIACFSFSTETFSAPGFFGVSTHKNISEVNIRIENVRSLELNTKTKIGGSGRMILKIKHMIDESYLIQVREYQPYKSQSLKCLI